MKLSYGQAMDLLAEDRSVKASEVSARALRRKVWVYGHGQPGCMYDSGPYYTDTKASAIACVVGLLADDDCKGAVTALRRAHVFSNSYGVATIAGTTLGSIL